VAVIFPPSLLSFWVLLSSLYLKNIRLSLTQPESTFVCLPPLIFIPVFPPLSQLFFWFFFILPVLRDPLVCLMNDPISPAILPGCCVLTSPFCPSPLIRSLKYALMNSVLPFFPQTPPVCRGDASHLIHLSFHAPQQCISFSVFSCLAVVLFFIFFFFCSSHVSTRSSERKNHCICSTPCCISISSSLPLPSALLPPFSGYYYVFLRG